MTRSKRAEKLIAMSEKERKAALAKMTPAQLRELRPHWEIWAHEGQIAPEGDWHTWLIMAGRAIIYLT